jgi:hypothetical protein
MRKLILASFSFKTGENQYTETRLVAVDFKITEATLPVITDHIVDWFKTAYQESEFISCVVYPTLEIYGLTADTIKAPNVDIPQIGYSAHSMFEAPPLFNREQNLSRKVVIDSNGHRKDFLIGWYDFDSHSWSIEGDTSLYEERHAKWMDILPLD